MWVVGCFLFFIASGGKLSFNSQRKFDKEDRHCVELVHEVQWDTSLNHPYLPVWFTPHRVFHTPLHITPIPKGHQPHNGPPYRGADLVLVGKVQKALLVPAYTCHRFSLFNGRQRDFGGEGVGFLSKVANIVRRIRSHFAAVEDVEVAQAVEGLE